MSGRCMMEIQGKNGKPRWADVPLLWTVEEDERLEDLDPPESWCFTAGHAVTLVDDAGSQWVVEVVADDRCDWLLKVRVVEPCWYTEFVAEARSAGVVRQFYGEDDVVLEVPRQRLVTGEQVSILEAVEDVLDGVLEPQKWTIRDLPFDDCGEWIAKIEKAQATIAPAFGDFLPYDSHGWQIHAWCDEVVAQILAHQRTMPKQLSLMGGTVGRLPTRMRSSGPSHKPATTPVSKVPDPAVQQLNLFAV